LLFPDKRKIAMLPRKDDKDKQIMREFALRQSRQFLAVSVALLLLLFLALLYKRQDLFGELSKDAVFAAEIVIFASFIGFSAFNWRCPTCKRYLGHNINRRMCRKCGTRLR
jgi:hypothetical protein